MYLSALIHIFHDVSSCFIMLHPFSSCFKPWNNDGEKNDACSLCRTACAKPKWHVIGSVKPKHIFLGPKDNGGLVGGCTV